MSDYSTLPPSNGAIEGGIKELLQHAIEHSHQLHKSLQDEHRALSSNNLNVFERAIEGKIAHTSELESIEKSMFSLLNNSGFKLDKKGIADYIATLKIKSDRTKITSLWKKLSQALLECQQQNQINGRILNMASVNMRQALDILTGHHGSPKMTSTRAKQTKKRNRKSVAIA